MFLVIYIAYFKTFKGAEIWSLDGSEKVYLQMNVVEEVKDLILCFRQEMENVARSSVRREDDEWQERG